MIHSILTTEFESIPSTEMGEANSIFYILTSRYIIQLFHLIFVICFAGIRIRWSNMATNAISNVVRLGVTYDFFIAVFFNAVFFIVVRGS